MSANLILLIIACICWFIAAIPAPMLTSRINIGWLGMFFFGLSLLIK
jgi:hypothetical protein